MATLLPLACSIALATAIHASAAIALDDAFLSSGTRIEMSATLIPVVPGGADVDPDPIRDVNLTVLVANVDASGQRRILWIMDDVSGAPRSHWFQRFGEVNLNPDLSAPNRLPTIRAERDGQSRDIAIRLPFFGATDQLRAEAEFEIGKLKYSVDGREDVGGRRTWRVNGSSTLGVRERLWIDADRRLVVQMREAVFLGQGVPHELQVRIDKSETLGREDLTHVTAAWDTLLAFRNTARLPLDDVAGAADLSTPELLHAARRVHGELQKSHAGSLYERVAREAVRDLDTGLQRASAIDGLASKARGKQTTPIKVPGVRGGEHAIDFQRGPVVLHFWDYRKEPLEAPYGEVGYLDFLWRQREKDGVRVLGIAVDTRLRDDSTRGAARKDIREFCTFMNLSYPVAFDETGVIDQFGDPRSVSGKLPLYVVVGADGKVAEYHAGLWSRSADEGLKELDTRLKDLLRK